MVQRHRRRKREKTLRNSYFLERNLIISDLFYIYFVLCLIYIRIYLYLIYDSNFVYTFFVVVIDTKCFDEPNRMFSYWTVQ